MREGVGRRDLPQLFAQESPERTTRRGEDEGVNLVGRAPLEALKRRRVLAVDRKQSSPAAALCSEGELARGDEALLVRERQVDSPFERPQGGREPREPHDGVEDQVGLRAFEQNGQIAADLGQRRQSVDRLGPGGGRAELELRMLLDDLEGLAADRACGSEECDPLHPGSVGSCREQPAT